MSMGATYVDKQGCIRPCLTSSTQEELPAECPQQSLDQTSQQQQQQQQSEQQHTLQPVQQLPQHPQQNQKQLQNPIQLDQSIRLPQLQLPNLSDVNIPLTDENNNPTSSSSSSCPKDLSGIWYGNDGGLYIFRQQGKHIAWFGSNLFNGGGRLYGSGTAVYLQNVFSNIGRGTFTENMTNINTSWIDVQYFSNHDNHGVMILSVEPSWAKILKVSDVIGTASFGGTEWTRKCSG